MATLPGQLVRNPHLTDARTIPMEHPHSPEFSISKKLARPMDVVTNSFCAVRGSALSAFGSLFEPEVQGRVGTFLETELGSM
jgi:hypothetical protein